MKKLVLSLCVVAALSFIGGVSVSAQVKAAWPWPASMDAVAAAPEVHKVLAENDHVRLLEVTLNPGQTEKLHDHRYPSAIIHDAPIGPRNNYDGVDKTTVTMEPLYQGSDWTTPQCRLWPTQGPHQLSNTGTYPVHFYRLEFKHMDGNDIMKKTKY